MWVYIFSGAGALIGPFIGSMLITYMPNPKIITTYSAIGVVMLIMTIWFLCAFWNFDDKHLIQESEYSRMEEEVNERSSMFGNELQNQKNTNLNPNRGRASEGRHSAKNELSMHFDDDELGANSEVYHTTQKSPDNPKRVRFNTVELTRKEKEMESRHSKEIKFIKSRKRISHMTATEVIKKDEVRRNLVLLGAVSWGVKVIDWMLFAIWVETPSNLGGMSFSNLETGAVSLLSFPCVAFALIACFQFTKKGK
jgi:hypothetical protein